MSEDTAEDEEDEVTGCFFYRPYKKFKFVKRENGKLYYLSGGSSLPFRWDFILPEELLPKYEKAGLPPPPKGKEKRHDEVDT